MAQKKLQRSSEFDRYDLDNDGVVTDAEIERAREIRETEDKSRKHLAQLRLARFALMGMGVYTILLFMPGLLVWMLQRFHDRSCFIFVLG